MLNPYTWQTFSPQVSNSLMIILALQVKKLGLRGLGNLPRVTGCEVSRPPGLRAHGVAWEVLVLALL